MTAFYDQSSLDHHVKQTLDNINAYIDGEGLKRKRLAKKLGMSESNFSDYLNGKRSNILDFSVRLAEVLDLEETFFMKTSFDYHSKKNDEIRVTAFSAGDLSEKGEEGLHQLLRLCDLIETYNMEDHSNA